MQNEVGARLRSINIHLGHVTLNKLDCYLQRHITMSTNDSATSIFCTVRESAGIHWFRCKSCTKYLFGLSFTPITESTIKLFSIELVEIIFRVLVHGQLFKQPIFPRNMVW